MRPARVSPAVPLALLVLLAGCGGGGGGSSDAAPAPADYLMLADGNRWLYASSAAFTSPAEDELLVRVSAATLADATPVWREDGHLLGANARYFVNLHLSATQLAVVADPPATPELRLRLPLTPGDSYPLLDATGDSGRDDDGDGLNESVRIQVQVQEIAPDTVDVPAGRFAALRVSSAYRFTTVATTDGSTSVGTATGTEWFVAGIGKVKMEYLNGLGLLRRELQGYRLAGVPSEGVAPQVVAVTPAAGASVSAPVEALSLDFSEAMDPDSLRLTLRDAAAQVLPGSSAYQARTLTFRPDAALPPGAYTVTVDAAADALGTALATPHSWSFTVE